MTLAYCSLSCWSSASLDNERCCTTEKVPRIPQTTATVSEIVRISRAEIDRSLNMRTPKLRQKGEVGTSQIMFNNLRLTGRSAVLPVSRHFIKIARDPIARPLAPVGHPARRRASVRGHGSADHAPRAIGRFWALLGVMRGCAGIGGEDHLADVFVMRVAGLDLLRNGVHVAEAALEFVGAEHRRGAGHVIGGIDHRGGLMDGPGCSQAECRAMVGGEFAGKRQIAPDLARGRIEIGARRAQTRLVSADQAL